MALFQSGTLLPFWVTSTGFPRGRSSLPLQNPFANRVTDNNISPLEAKLPAFHLAVESDGLPRTRISICGTMLALL